MISQAILRIMKSWISAPSYSFLYTYYSFHFLDSPYLKSTNIQVTPLDFTCIVFEEMSNYGV